MSANRKGVVVAVLVAAVLLGARAVAAPIEIIVSTPALNGVAASLAFDLIDGGPPSNAVTLSGFQANGSLGGASGTGDVAGTFPGSVQLGDSSFFNEYLQNVTLGTTLRFVFDATGQPAAPGSSPDAFSFFILDAATLLPLFTTSDPTGADAMLRFDMGASIPLQLFTSSSATIRVAGPNAVPAPGTGWLVLPAFLLALAMRRS